MFTKETASDGHTDDAATVLEAIIEKELPVSASDHFKPKNVTSSVMDTHPWSKRKLDMFPSHSLTPRGNQRSVQPRELIPDDLSTNDRYFRDYLILC